MRSYLIFIYSGGVDGEVAGVLAGNSSTPTLCYRVAMENAWEIIWGAAVPFFCSTEST
ncbi:hypothetical protein M2390_000830 [Mycetocola sp. BIGb0189]|nr:hypothetical protein [Mycetocola sp. BIGb0189]